MTANPSDSVQRQGPQQLDYAGEKLPVGNPRDPQPDDLAARPFLCRIGLHRWRFISPNLTGTGCAEQCKRCGRKRIMLFTGGSYYVD